MSTCPTFAPDKREFQNPWNLLAQRLEWAKGSVRMHHGKLCPFSYSLESSCLATATFSPADYASPSSGLHFVVEVGWRLLGVMEAAEHQYEKNLSNPGLQSYWAKADLVHANHGNTKQQLAKLHGSLLQVAPLCSSQLCQPNTTPTCIFCRWLAPFQGEETSPPCSSCPAAVQGQVLWLLHESKEGHLLLKVCICMCWGTWGVPLTFGNWGGEQIE